LVRVVLALASFVLTRYVAFSHLNLVVVVLLPLTIKAGGETVFPKVEPTPSQATHQAASAAARQEMMASGVLGDVSSWESKMTQECGSRFAVPPKKGDALLFYSQVRSHGPYCQASIFWANLLSIISKFIIIPVQIHSILFFGGFYLCMRALILIIAAGAGWYPRPTQLTRRLPSAQRHEMGCQCVDLERLPVFGLPKFAQEVKYGGSGSRVLNSSHSSLFLHLGMSFSAVCYMHANRLFN